MNTVRVQDGQLMVDNSTIAFYAPDRAVVTSGNQRGNPVESTRAQRDDPDAPILAKQPDPAPYVGVYRRPPMGMNTVRVQDGQLRVDDSAIAFYAPDRAVVTSGNQRGNPVEFIRNAKGEVGWVRLVGRIARKD